MTKKSRMIRFGKIIAKASSRPNRPPDAPTVGAPEPSTALTSSWVSAAAITLAKKNTRKRFWPHTCSSSPPNIHRPSMLKNRWLKSK
jgi:hypothetical protein